ncbi:MAG: hypothetical protein K2M72_09425 [Paramuribaculum sp.]|nr:hypothetical protein [Paramuribaculum sp.]
MLLAIGNAGGNIIDTMRQKIENAELKGAEYVLVDCEESDLSNHTSGDCKSTLLDYNSDEFPVEIFDGIGKLVIVAGLGGKTATKYVELAATTAKVAGVKSINVVVTLPFHFEGEERISIATSAAQRLSELKDVKTILFNNEDLMNKYPDLNFFNAFEAADLEMMYIAANLV